MFNSKNKPEAAAPTAKPAVAPTTTAPAAVAETKKPAAPAPCQNVIGKGTVIEGNVIAEGDLVIEGIVRGDVTTKTSLAIGPTCAIEGNILAQHAEVAGTVRGTVQALGLLVIKSSGVIDGDVITKNLNVESGSTFNGRCQVGNAAKAVEPKPGATKKPEASMGDSVFGMEQPLDKTPAKV